DRGDVALDGAVDGDGEERVELCAGVADARGLDVAGAGGGGLMPPTPSQWDDRESQVRAWFDAAAEAGPEERARIIAEARAKNPEAAEELESLLLHLSGADAVLGNTPLQVVGLLA